MTDQRPRVRQGLLIIALAACMAAGGGAATAQSVSPASSAAPDDPSTLEAQLATANARIAQLEEQSHRLDDLVAYLDEMYDSMEAERQLLIELRKPIPDQRDSAEAYIRRLQALAIISDPVRLGQPASRLLETAPTYLDWRDGDYASQADRDAAYLSSGAAGFNADFDELQKAILLTVANSLDSLLNLRDRLR